MENFLWQLTWRVPGLKPGTSLLTNEIPFSYYTDNSFTPLINLTYAPQSKQFDLPYILLFINLRWGGKIPALVPGYPIVVRDRSTVFDSTTDHALVILYNPPHCLRVIDPAIDGKDSFLPFDIASALAVSHPDQILVNQQPAAVPPKDIFDLEQTHTWCYYFEKAELARQQQDWTEIAALGGDAYKISNHPKFATENLVFIEGYARAGQWKQALDLTHQTYAYDRNIQVMLCDTWARISRSHPTDAEGLSAIQAIGSAYACSDLQGP